MPSGQSGDELARALRVPITKPLIGEAEREAVLGPLETGWVVQGPKVQEFERRFGEYTGAEHAVATTSCTTALHLAVAILGLKPGDEVIVPAFTWVSTANVVEYMGAKPVFCDVELETFNIDPAKIEELITPKTVGMIPVHLFGLCAEMGPISELAEQHDLWIVEDAACGFGALQGGRHAGTFGDIGAFSFHPRKSITTGEGGMLTTANSEWDELARSLRDHGGDQTDLTRHESPRGFLLSDFNVLGYNYRMTDLQGALGCAQMERAEEILDERRRLAARYDEALAGLDWLAPPIVPEDNVHGYQSYVCLYGGDGSLERSGELNERRNELMLLLEQRGIATRQGTHAPVATGFYSRRYDLDPEDFPVSIVSERLSLALPLFPGMSDEEQDLVVEELLKAQAELAMCGIAGVLNRSDEPVSIELLRAMSDAIAHRGPDGEGQFAEGPVGLANRRLAIIDPVPEGNMPMTSESGDLVITYNGEVYNYRELRTELERAGHHFRTATDTEVVLEAYAEWGPACVERFNGMFGLAIWDRAKRELFLARDRYGIKPLYFADLDGAFLFGSEIKSMLVHPALKAKVSLPHLLEYFTFQNTFTEGTMFEGVELLRPAHRILLREGDRTARPERYWDFDFTGIEDGTSEEEYEEELDRLFRIAVERQLVSDVPVGAHLSGGMDSGSITAVAAQSLPYLNTFTVGFDMNSSIGLEQGDDERVKAEAMSYAFRTEHYEAVLKAGDMERCLPWLVWHLEDLRVGQSYPNYYVAKLASKFVKVVLTGSGGDGFFAGYPWRYYRAVVNESFDAYVEKYYRFWHRLIPNSNLPGFFRGEVWDQVSDVSTLDIFRAEFPDARAPASPEEYVEHSLYLEARTFLHGLLVVEDKLSMAHSLENRVPFLDNDLVDFAQRLSVRHKLRDLENVVALNENEPGPKTQRYFEKTRDGKLILRKVMNRYVPDEISNQVKQGFSGPDSSWFRGDSIEYVRDLLFSPDAAIYEYLEPEGVKALVNDHFDGRENRRLLLWSLICFEHWCRTFLKEGSAAGAAAR